MIRVLSSEAPAGFRPVGPDGILVPAGVERQRQTWTHDEWRLIDRAAKLLASRGIKLTLTCDRPDCSGAIAQVPDVNDPTLECDCTTRVFVRAL